MKITTIYLDLDGVLANFIDGINKLGYTKSELDNFPNKIWPKIYMKGSYFWKNLKLMPGAIKLYNACCKKVGINNVIILTAIPHTAASKTGKQLWCKKYFKFAKCICVKRTDKVLYANRHSLLIDDFYKNIDDFNQASGYSIHFISCNSTIKKLNELC